MSENSEVVWNDFDADSPNSEVERYLRTQGLSYLLKFGIDCSNVNSCLEYARTQVENYKGGSDLYNEVLGVHLFKPSEFTGEGNNHESLNELRSFLSGNSFDWRKGSSVVQDAIGRKFTKLPGKKVSVGRSSVILDCLIEIDGRKIALEIEGSTNLDNGYFSLRQAVRQAIADYGVMVVPYTAEGSGRADEDKAISRLDGDFDGVKELRDGPIYQISIVRCIDVYRWIVKKKGVLF
ncbi:MULTISPECIES: hypothetical protein [unclassified Maridesulfovibrio]|uniref:hypothetical protein n=1 Tax=unclassified Maridesulfovibrio TaxID=2794999 RepID=UPI003B422753